MDTFDFLINLILIFPFEGSLWLIQVLRWAPYVFFIQVDFWFFSYDTFKDKLVLIAQYIVLDNGRFQNEYSDNLFLYT